ncbi:MAG: M20/M25/M40 family metallo-hydrolase, partial [Planctomycetes bacterium]|nr:M20/M25/M40 family metallo-hydrolase [Planctomycetota bacterium]
MLDSPGGPPTGMCHVGQRSQSIILDGEPPSRKEVGHGMARSTSRFPPRPLRRLLIAWAMSAATATEVESRATELLAAAVNSISPNDAARHVAALADDAFEGREGGSRGGRAAAAYIIEQIETLGFEPAGDGGSYLQSFGAGHRNILAMLPGSDPELAREIVIVGAHYDHVGYGKAGNSFGPFGFVHNGADDNASGVAGVIEVMESLVLLGERPRRTILVAFWDGEEQGLLGSRHFVRVRPAAVAGRPIAFCLNLDMIGRLRNERLIVYGARTGVELRSAIVAANNAPGTGASLDLSFDWDVLEDSDHHPFIMGRIPTMMLHTGLHDQYHRPSDDVNLVNFVGIAPVVRLTLALAVGMADAPQRPVFRAAALAESNATKRRLETRPPGGSSRGRWGIVTRPDPGEPAAPLVVNVAHGSPAQVGGLRAGDRLVAVDGHTFGDQTGMVALL